MADLVDLHLTELKAVCVPFDSCICEFVDDSVFPQFFSTFITIDGNIIFVMVLLDGLTTTQQLLLLS